MNYFKHEKSIVETTNIGDGTKIWAFAHILSNVIIGKDCNICDHTYIDNNVKIGNRVTIKSGVYLWEGIIIEDEVFIGPNATFTNDKFPRSKNYPQKFAETLIREGASIGANATLLPGLTIGQYAMVGAGTVVTKNIPPYAIVIGNPARIVGYVKADKKPTIINSSENLYANGKQKNLFDNVRLYEFPIVPDIRGSLIYSEYSKTMPFLPKRFFIVYDVPSKETRGEHAHKECSQFLVCIKGQCSVVVDNGKFREEVLLNSPNLGLLIPPMIWATQYNYTNDAVLLVLASDLYEEEDYIRDYDQFLLEIKKNEK